MPRFKTFTSYSLLGLHVLLLFLLLFQDKVVLPSWLQPVGRMHPMLLHLPIGLLVLAGALWLFKKEFEGFEKLFDFTLSLTALSAALAALMGFFLSKEEGYTAELLAWHKYSGVALSFLCYGLLWLNQNYADKKAIFNISFIATTFLLLITGHFGASLTHGEDYLFPNKNANDELVVTPETPVFAAVIQPILKAKCYQCHNEQKQKGELLMTSIAGLLKGGKDGPLWVAGNALNSHIIQRANLPLEAKKHMPPKGKTQLTPQEIGLLTAWVNAGADVKKPMQALAANDPLKKLVDAQLAINQTNNALPTARTYDFSAASEETIKKLNNPFRSVFPLAHDSPALQADFFVRREYKPEQLTELSEIKTQLVALSLANMPIKDEDLKTIAQFQKLEKLILNNTDISGKTLSTLGALSALQTLGLSGTKINKESVASLSKLPNLKDVFVWNTPITAKDIADLQKQVPKISFKLGYVPNDSEILKINAPILVNESLVITDQTLISYKHPLKGVTIRYTTDGGDPDTTSSTLYEKPFLITSDYTTVKARAMKEKWFASNIIEHSFFKAKYHPDQAELINEPNKQYVADGGKTLIDQKKADITDFKMGWLGFREKPFEGIFTFTKPTPVKSLTIGFAKNIGSFVMPPTSVEIWGGLEKNHLKLLKKIIPTPAKKDEPNRVEVVKATLPENNYQVFKIIARPVSKLPEWHPGKGQQGWVMIDEIFFN